MALRARVGGRVYRHSRYWSQRLGLPVSRLCLADKLAFAITPAWLYIPMARWTGELAEYMDRLKERQAGDRSFTDEELTLLNSGCPASTTFPGRVTSRGNVTELLDVVGLRWRGAPPRAGGR